MSENRSARRARQRGFTLAELMVVIVILGLLFTLVVPELMGKLFKAEVGTAKTQVQMLATAVRDYAINNNGRFPETLEELVTPDANDLTYLQDATTVPLDPWDNEFFYHIDPNGMSFEVGTYGADGQPGGEGKNADISNKTLANRAKEE